jgi:hypothetical protein
MLAKIRDFLTMTFAACCVLAPMSWAETKAMRLGLHFRDSAGETFQSLGSVSGFLDKLKLDMPQFQKKV